MQKRVRTGNTRDTVLEFVACFWPSIVFTLLLIPLSWWVS